MASGTPIVCSDIHGYKGVVRRNEQAVLVPPRDVEALAAALGTLLRDPLLRQRMGESGRERAVQFSWENITAKVEDYYGFVIRRLASRNALPSGFKAEVPEAPQRAPGLWSSHPEDEAGERGHDPDDEAEAEPREEVPGPESGAERSGTPEPERVEAG
jgi:hypothetical protein